MAQLQFLNGARDAEVQDLPEEAGLLLGSQAGSYILVSDQAVESRHATVYSVKGQFYVRPNMTMSRSEIAVPTSGTGRKLTKHFAAADSGRT